MASHCFQSKGQGPQCLSDKAPLASSLPLPPQSRCPCLPFHASLTTKVELLIIPWMCLSLSCVSAFVIFSTVNTFSPALQNSWLSFNTQLRNHFPVKSSLVPSFSSQAVQRGSLPALCSIGTCASINSHDSMGWLTVGPSALPGINWGHSCSSV